MEEAAQSHARDLRDLAPGWVEYPLPRSMTDRLSTEHRSWLMRRVRSKNTEPEFRVRRLVHKMGYRYRLHRRDLPGTPDLTFPGRTKVIFVHGCFWHQHDCPRGRRPASKKAFWNEKLDGNLRRDRRNIAALEQAGWTVLVIWECETKDPEFLAQRIKSFLELA